MINNMDMRDYKQIRGLNPKKTVPSHLGHYCAALDVAEKALTEEKDAVRDGLGAFLTSLLWEGAYPAEATDLTVSDLIYGGLPGVQGHPARPAAYPEAEKQLHQSWHSILRTVARRSFDFGLRGGFNRPEELAGRLEQDIKLPLFSPLEVLFPVELWNMPLPDLQKRYQPQVNKVRAERTRYQRDLEAAQIRRKSELDEKLAALSYEGPPGFYYASEMKEELAALKGRYSPEEIGLLLMGGHIRLSEGLRRKYKIDPRIRLDKNAYVLDYLPRLHLAESRESWRDLALSYEKAVRQDRNAALEEARAKNKERSLRRQRNTAIRAAIVRNIPENYIDFFPLARAMERRFVLHIGPTNSGKTHDAMEALKQGESGIYLGPLRLLAFEQYEALNGAGYPCSLVTGEERLDEEGALFQASTIEMLNTQREYDVAVIDEAQMIGDPDRGGSWTRAILGICAREIHVCAAPIAKNLLIRLIKDCGDSYELVPHHRMTPLKVEREEFSLDEDVSRGDALIVFSRKSVHGVASYLQQRGYRCSVVYGALPYDVRREQARLFAEGETDTVVATDAIGMGMNLPIRRVIFLEQDKFDGYERRMLKTEEIKQIAGRAGRYGIYPLGLVNTTEHKAQIREALEGRSEAVKTAVIAFPESLLGVDASLTEIIERWIQIEIKPGYTRADPYRMLRLCRIIQDLSEDKRFLYDCISMTFDEEDEELLSIWRQMCAREAAGHVFPVAQAMPDAHGIEISENLNELEEAFRLCDLLYGYCEKFDHREHREEIMDRKNLISRQMTQILARQSLSGKKCPGCGRPLPWNHPYRLCDSCFKRERRYGPRKKRE